MWPSNHRYSTAAELSLARAAQACGFSALSLTDVFALYFGGGMSIVYFVPLLLLCAALAWVSMGGRKLVESLPIVVH